MKANRSTAVEGAVVAEYDMLTITAHHEAGHAMAAVMRGGSILRGVSIDVDRPGHGLTLMRAATWDSGFLAYAGPWAEARYLWELRSQADTDVDVDDECSFADQVIGVLLHQVDDAAAWSSWLHDPEQERTRQVMAKHGLTFAPEEVWDLELGRLWPNIQSLARRIRAGETITDSEVRDLYDSTADDTTV